MTTITTLQSELAALDAFLAGEHRNDERALTDFLLPMLRIDNVGAVAAQLPRPLGELFTHATPVQEWSHAMRTTMTLRSAPEQERTYQWSFRYPISVVATFERGARPPVGWAPRGMEKAARSAEPWDRLWSLSEIVRQALPLPEDSEVALAALDDDDPEVCWWAWLTAVWWAELDPERGALRDGVARRAPSAAPHVAPLAAWAALLLDCTGGLSPALARSLAGPRIVAYEALDLIRRLGPRVDDMGALIEPLIESEEVDCAAISALVINAPHRWRRVWELTFETELWSPPKRRRPPNAPPAAPEPPYWRPTSRATVSRFVFGDAPAPLPAEAAETILAHAHEWWAIPALARLGPHARAAVPALVARLEADVEKGASNVREVVRALGAMGGDLAWDALERLAVKSEWVASNLAEMGESATPMLARLLAAPLAPKVHERILEGMTAALPSLAPAVLRFLEAEDAHLRLWALYACGGFAVDDAMAVRLASVFIECSGEVSPFEMPLHFAAERMAPIWASRIEHESDIVAVRCIEALGWSREYGEDHVPALRAHAARVSGTSVRGRAALEAAERIEDPEPMFRPNS